MGSIKDLNQIIEKMTPILNDDECVFVSLKSWDNIDHKNIIGSFTEKEGITLIMNVDQAKKLKLKYEGTYAWITLNVHSALDAVGFTAKFSTALGLQNVSCNVIAGYYHDHIFVPIADAKKAMHTLDNLS